MTEANRPEIPQDEMKKKVGSDMPERKPLPLLPDREWLNATIIEVKYQVSMFNNQVQYVTDQEGNPILDDDGNQIMRKEFEIVFAFDDYTIPGKDDPRKAWLRMGASFGEKAHLPQFLYNVLGPQVNVETPADIIEALKGLRVKLQVSNKYNKEKDRTYQNVVFDAVKTIGAQERPQPEAIAPDEIDPEEGTVGPDGEPVAWDE